MNDKQKLDQLKRLAQANVPGSRESCLHWADEVRQVATKSPRLMDAITRPLNVLGMKGLPEDLYADSVREMQGIIGEVAPILEKNILAATTF